MANDGSMASLTEDWIVATLQALSEFEERNVVVYDGSIDGKDPMALPRELGNMGSPAVIVLFEGDRAIPLQEGAVAYEPTYGIYTGIKNQRPGAARTGDGTTMGTNGARDVLRSALHDKTPGIAAGGYHADLTEFRGSQLVMQAADMFILKSTLVVQEMPTS